MISAHCPICANLIGEVSPKAALLWIEMVSMVRNPNDVIVTPKPQQKTRYMKILEENGYIVTHEDARNFFIRLEGGEFDTECVFFCADETYHGMLVEDDDEAEEMF